MTMMLKKKNDAFNKFKKLNTLVEQETWENIKTLRADKGGEFVS